MRIGGIASGIDTESIVRDLMKVEKLPLDRFFQRKQTIEWKRDAYREMNLQLKNLHDSASSLRLRSSLNTRQTSIGDSKVLTATANATVRNGTYEVNVNKIAQAERYTSTAETHLNVNETINTSEFGTGFTITTYNDEGVANTIEFTTGDKSLSDLFNEINKSDIGVQVYFDSTFNKVVLERKETGIRNANGSEIEFGNGDGGNFQLFLNKLNISLTLPGEDQIEPTNPNQRAGNAIFSFTDPVLGTKQYDNIRSNRTNVGGISLNLQNTGTTSLTITSNTDDAFDKIKSFVEKYNEVIQTIQSKVSERVNRGFPPLTDEQRRELSDKEAELWDEKSKSGLLTRDQTLTSSLSRLRLDLYSPVETSGRYNQIAQLGITTTSNFQQGGKLEIDEAKLRAALADDPDAVHQLLNGVAESGSTNAYSQTGLIGRLRSTIDNTIKEIETRAGNQFRTNQQFSLGRELINVDQQIDRFQRRLTDIENRYWAQFSAMEKAMNQANSQAMAFMSQLMGQ
ncbi:hypothetical protein DS745_07740 [Anaerobacillus alkaliphilus]|uniref:Flagellar hook-associated protein 2 n=1 Tax=Anaerobacillus alkaliphilus TaxID=1548597 RepID=A0A4Q0VW08_9BACI|nr:flagellar filament capping protein FliD [Anaerobacillus alkaliphilus]RXJ02272.1 hypothetical protein DS745_07740 [Anaerobacillus alkaliphilus]